MVKVTPHFIDRFSERVCRKTRRVELFANRAYRFGNEVDALNSNKLKNYLKRKEIENGSKCRIYNGFVYWFSGNTAVTVYLLPKVSKFKEAK